MKLIQLNSEGKSVVILQKLLQRGNFPIRISGIFDAETDRVVKSFQQTNGLAVDGKVGKNTWRTLFARHYDLKLGVRVGTSWLHT